MLILAYAGRLYLGSLQKADQMPMSKIELGFLVGFGFDFLVF